VASYAGWTGCSGRKPNFPVAQDPMSCVALGVGRVLDELELLKKVTLPA